MSLEDFYASLAQFSAAERVAMPFTVSSWANGPTMYCLSYENSIELGVIVNLHHENPHRGRRCGRYNSGACSF